MKNLFLKIKGLLGFCQCDKCWHRSTLIVENKEVKLKRYICENCFEKIMNVLSSTEIE
ncbi:MAG: hypothetical protein ACLUG2_04395 [Clostridium perfringens]|nr:hypothetical protein [Clostridium perfringens]MDH2460235.1 hypothetical protein [Clostridium perfringens]MDU1475401.1 hypothetical protein [Clostridium perfringens]